MSKKVTIVIDRKTGDVAHDFEGFQGDDCFAEAARIKAKLAKRGIVLGEGEVVRKETPPAIPEVGRTRRKVGGKS